MFEWPKAEMVKKETLAVQGALGVSKNPKIVKWVYLFLLFIFTFALILGGISLWRAAFPPKAIYEPYLSVQTVYENSPNSETSYVDLNGRGLLVPLESETLQAAIDFGKQIGEEGKIYRHRVVVMALDPATRYTDFPSGKTLSYFYDPQDVYIFYVPDGKDIRDKNAREHIIMVGEKKYRVILLTIDGRNNTLAYTFRIEEVIE